MVDPCENLLNITDEKLIFRTSIEIYGDLKHRLDELLPKIAKLKGRISSPDPTKRTYGESMQKKVMDLMEKFDCLYSAYQEELFPKLDKLLQQQELHFDTQQTLFLFRKRLRKEIEEEKHLAVQRGREETEEEEAARRVALEAQENLISARQQKILQEEDEKRQQEEQRKKQLELATQHFHQLDEKFAERYISLCFEGLLRLATLPLKFFKETLRAIIELASQIYSDPTELSLRVIRLENIKFGERIGNKPGALLILRAIGFTLNAAELLKDIFASLSIIPRDKDELFLYLEEPHVYKDYDNWRKWLDRIEHVQKTLVGLILSQRSSLKQCADGIARLSAYASPGEIIDVISNLQATVDTNQI
ncbi:hypothetical protein IE077_004322 [Cardiosporidium cionae]|uniref:Uncharacterized protein n=1 Tax=Cardiosporidium cionae TaxID=476202 RepID=A0ABQ7JC17_9APIC|nr:hypothetical protein IE077_004322 [Cardiosporidium cionae]|eukprot:KAF8821516.1 hypothetical protein IE077_004322 [Cardiosporidium cionae]